MRVESACVIGNRIRRCESTERRAAVLVRDGRAPSLSDVLSLFVVSPADRPERQRMTVRPHLRERRRKAVRCRLFIHLIRRKETSVPSRDALLAALRPLKRRSTLFSATAAGTQPALESERASIAQASPRAVSTTGTAVGPTLGCSATPRTLTGSVSLRARAKTASACHVPTRARR